MSYQKCIVMTEYAGFTINQLLIKSWTVWKSVGWEEWPERDIGDFYANPLQILCIKKKVQMNLLCLCDITVLPSTQCGVETT